MSDQQSWKPLKDRTPEVKQKVDDVYEQIADKTVFVSALDLYDEYNWGLVADGLLYRGLIESARQNLCLSADEIMMLQPTPLAAAEYGSQEIEEEGIEIAPVVDDETGNPLRWFRQSTNKKIRDEADDEFSIRLLELYIAHVSKTGETYFPPLEKKLRDMANFYGN